MEDNEDHGRPRTTGGWLRRQGHVSELPSGSGLGRRWPVAANSVAGAAGESEGGRHWGTHTRGMGMVHGGAYGDGVLA